MRILKPMFLLPAFLLLGAGCATQRFVTTSHWGSQDTLYVAYAEVGGTMASKVKKCSRQPNNALVCEHEKNLEQVLNAK